MPPAAPKDRPKSRWLVNSAGSVIMLYLGADITSTFLIATAQDALYFDQPIAWQLGVSWGTAVKLYCMMKLNYTIAAVLAVALGISTPQVRVWFMFLDCVGLCDLFIGLNMLTVCTSSTDCDSSGLAATIWAVA